MTASPAAAARRLAARVAAALLLLVTLAACDSDPQPGAADMPPPDPLLYEIAAADGSAVEGWLLGTIHALPPGTRWRTPAIARVTDAADLLVVEVAGLADEAAIGRTFADLATGPGLPPLAERVPADLRPQLAAVLARGGLAESDFAARETWAAAIALARVDATGDLASGVDRALLADFRGRPVRELEGARGQLAIFDRLPEAAQRAMLAGVLRESERARRDPARLQRAWLAGDEVAIAAATREGFLADPTLRAGLLTERNRRWTAALGPLLEQAPRPLIAVGAAHLVGPEGLAAQLAAAGYRVRRIR